MQTNVKLTGIFTGLFGSNLAPASNWPITYSNKGKITTAVLLIPVTQLLVEVGPLPVVLVVVETVGVEIVGVVDLVAIELSIENDYPNRVCTHTSLTVSRRRGLWITTSLNWWVSILRCRGISTRRQWRIRRIWCCSRLLRISWKRYTTCQLSCHCHVNTHTTILPWAGTCCLGYPTVAAKCVKRQKCNALNIQHTIL